MDAETQAIDELTAMIMGEELPPQPEEAPAEETPAPAAQATPEAEMKIDVAKLFAEQNKIVAEQQRKIEELMKEKEASREPTEEERMIAEAQQKLGIDMQKQQELYAMAEEFKKQKMFDGMVAEFKKEFPEIELKEMGEFANTNNLSNLLNSGDVNQWKVVATAMRLMAKPKQTPDAITPTAQKGAETTVWERLQKNEDVSDTEFGAALLKAGNAL